MTRPSVRLDRAHAQRIHDVLCDIVPGMGVPGIHNPLGVDMGSVAPITVPIGEVVNGTAYSEITSAVYIVTDDTMAVRYVGSIHRSTSALKDRLRAHRRIGIGSRSAWANLGLVRLPTGLSKMDVLRCEGWVGRVLDPLDNERLPLVDSRPWVPRALAG